MSENKKKRSREIANDCIRSLFNEARGNKMEMRWVCEIKRFIYTVLSVGGKELNECLADFYTKRGGKVSIDDAFDLVEELLKLADLQTFKDREDDYNMISGVAKIMRNHGILKDDIASIMQLGTTAYFKKIQNRNKL